LLKLPFSTTHKNKDARYSSADNEDIDPTTIHHIAKWSPQLGRETGLVATRVVEGAFFESVHPDLTGPAGTQDANVLLGYLGRVTTREKPTAENARYVKPGVGRSYHVKDVHMQKNPELHDFVVTGAGLTPYSINGFFADGPVNGLAALVRVRHRKRNSDRLEKIGGRTAPVVAVLRFPGVMAPLPDGTEGDAGVVVRGFRCVLRVRSLDPATIFYQSMEHAPLVGPAILQFAKNSDAFFQNDPDALLRMLDTYNTGYMDIRLVLWPRLMKSNLDAEAVALRRLVIDSYAPLVLAFVRERLALELGRDHATEPIGVKEYVLWFATTIGHQLAIWYKHRFLHDYHKPGIERYNGLMTLVESNVTLLAEFPDLDTAMFVDSDDDGDALQLSQHDRNILRDGFKNYHCQELEAARAVVRSLACLATRCDPDMVRWANATFLKAYANER
jgi:hypothetical protein